MTSVMAMAESIAQMSPVAVQGTKVNLNYARDHNIQEGLDFVVSLFLYTNSWWGKQTAECFALQAHWNKSMLQSEDILKAAMAMISKSEEAPEFSKL